MGSGANLQRSNARAGGINSDQPARSNSLHATTLAIAVVVKNKAATSEIGIRRNVVTFAR